MKSTLALLVVLALALLSAPLLTSAQSTDEESFWGWFRRGSEYRAQIEALGSNAVASLPIPILFGVSLNNITSNFGDVRGGGTRTHEGLDIMAPMGTPVVSPTEAVVTRVGDGSSSGLTVSTANPGGERFVYMHLSRIGEGVVEGAVLEVGSLIGYVGNTGNASGGAPHLHFEIHSGGAIDPFPRITTEFTAAEKSAYLSAILAKSTDTSLAQRIAQYIPTLSIATAAASEREGAVAILSRDLKRGMTGTDVRALQVLLNAEGFTVSLSGPGSPGQESTYFGPATLSAVIRFQKARAIAPTVGYVGPLTRAALLS